MSDLISRQQALNVIERMRAYIGHNMERAVGVAFIEILDDVGEDIGRLPSAQPEIIRCKDCKYWVGVDTCDVIDAPVWDNDFCSMAERREE